MVTETSQSMATRQGQTGGQQDSLYNKKYWTRGDVNEITNIVDYYLETRHQCDTLEK